MLVSIKIKSDHHFHRSVVGIAILLALGHGHVMANTDQRLPQVLVHGEEIGDEVERLQREQARDMKDVLGREANVDLAGGVRNGQRLYLRGVEGTNVNITVDGARQGQNLYNHRGGLSNVDPDILKQVDVRPGPPAADDGHGALGGSVRMTTVDAQDLLGRDQSIGARLRAGYSSADKGRRGSISVYGMAGDQVGLLAHVSRQDYKDFRTGEGDRIPYSGGEDESYLFKLSMLDTGPHQLRLGRERHEASGLQFQQRGDYPWQMQPHDPRTRPPRDQTLVREQTTLEYRFDPSSRLVDVQLNLYQNENSWQVMTGNGATERFISDGQGYDLRNTFHFGGSYVHGSLTVGVDYLEDKGTNHRSDRPERRNHYENQGLYAQNRLEAERGQLWFGVRHDDFKASFRNKTTRTANKATSYNIGGEGHFGAGISLFAGYGESARGAGTIPIHFAGNIVEGGALLNGSAIGELKPEVSRQSELGLRWQHEDGGTRIGAEALTFQNRISDAILYDQPGSGGLGGRPVTEFYNADQTAIFKGYELRAHYHQGPLRGSLSFMHMDTDGLPEQAQFLARFGAPHGNKLVLNLDYSVRENLEFGYALTHVARLKNVPEGQGIYMEKPGYSVHDMYLNWQPLGMRQLSLDFAVRNLFDKSYSRHTTLSQNGFSTQEPGRDVRVGMRYVF